MPASRTVLSSALALSLAGVTLGFAAVSPATAATMSRHAAVVPAALPSVIPSWAWNAPTSGATPADQKVLVLLTLNQQDQAGLANLVTAQTTPGTGLTHSWLSKAVLEASYAPTAATLSGATAALSALGVTDIKPDALGLTLLATMPASQAETIFGVGFRQIMHGGESTRVATNEPTLPTSLVPYVSIVSGLTQELLHPDLVMNGVTYNSQGLPTSTPTVDLPTPPGTSDSPPAFYNAPPYSTYYASTLGTDQPTYPVLAGDASTTKPYNPQGYTAAQIRGAYDVGKVSYTGAGVKIGIVDAFDGPKVATDLARYSTEQNLAVPMYTDISTELEAETDAMGDNLLDPLGWEGEQTLDVEAVHLMAPGATIVYSGATAPEDPAFEQAIVAAAGMGVDQISNSYGGTGDADPADEQALDSAAMTVAALGVGLDFSTGDDADNVAANAAREVDFPAASPYVTGVGGTGIEIGKNNDYEGEFYWGVLKEFKTTDNKKWDDTNVVANGGGGGGVSEENAQPTYQAGVVPAAMTENADAATNYGQTTGPGADAPGRTLPDVAMIADATTGMAVGETQIPTGGTAGAGTDVYSYYRIGGTSVSSPIFTGMLALVDQALGTSAGFVNAQMYAFVKAKGADGAFRDPKVGQNSTRALDAPVAKPNNTPVVAEVRSDYATTTDKTTAVSQTLRRQGTLSTLADVPGYDDSTGLGSPDAPQFIADFTGTAVTAPPTPEIHTPALLLLAGAAMAGAVVYRRRRWVAVKQG